MMSIMDAALLGLVGALFMAVAAMAWRVPRAISESSDKLGARLDAKIDTQTAQLHTKIDTQTAQLHTKIDDVAAQLHTKIDDTNVMLADVRERVAYLEGRADPPPQAA